MKNDTLCDITGRKTENPQDWYKVEGSYERVHFVKSTWKLSLKVRVEMLFKKYHLKTKVVEWVGETSKSIL